MENAWSWSCSRPVEDAGHAATSVDGLQTEQRRAGSDDVLEGLHGEEAGGGVDGGALVFREGVGRAEDVGEGGGDLREAGAVDPAARVVGGEQVDGIRDVVDERDAGFVPVAAVGGRVVAERAFGGEQDG